MAGTEKRMRKVIKSQLFFRQVLCCRSSTPPHPTPEQGSQRLTQAANLAVLFSL